MEYWLWTDDYPYDGFDDWGIFEFEYAEEDEYGPDNAIVTGIIYKTPGALELDEPDDIYDDAIADDPRRVIAFLMDGKF